MLNETERNRNRRWHKIGFGCKVQNCAKVMCGNMWPTYSVSLQLCTFCFLSGSDIEHVNKEKDSVQKGTSIKIYYKLSGFHLRSLKKVPFVSLGGAGISALKKDA